MSYQALYRKWRPADFKDVKGQDHIVVTLQNQVKADRIGHAYLFCGTRGTGKTSVAKILAKAVNCENPQDGNPCGECASCKAISAGTSMNVIEIDAASNNGVDNIREIREEVQYSPTEGRFKVYIIDEVHMLSIGAFNALLKTLEEPPAYVIFILATTEAHKIPITILSRCQRYDFHRISIETIAERLSALMEAEQVEVEDRAIRYIAKAADGSMRDALSLLDQCIAFYLGRELKYENVLEVLGAVDTEIFSQLLGMIIAGDCAGCLSLLDEVIIQGRDLSQFVSDFIWYLRNLLLVRTTNYMSRLEDVIDASAENLKQMSKDAQMADADTLIRYIRILSDLENDMRYAVNKRIKAEVALIKLGRPAMDKSADLEEIRGRLSLLETQLADAQQKLKNGVLPSGFTEKEQKEPAPAAVQAERKEAEALPEELEKIAVQWDSIVYSIDDMLMRTFLSQANVALSRNRAGLEIFFQSPSAYNAFSREDDKKRLEELIEERTGIRVPIVITKLETHEDFQNRFTDIRELVNMDIVVDDKEEYI